MGGYAWVTLATNNSYSLGALVLAHSLKKANTAHKLVVLITPAVSLPMREQLQTVFDLVKVVDVLDSKDEAHLALMKRPDLGITFTKIHCWRLVEFEKCVFLDADTLVVRNCDELFEKEEFSAAPDVSWPDCFNSGVFVYRPSIDTFNKILQFAVENRSFDGGDQGLLNQFFSDWATEDIKKHLPFVYNLTSIAAYSYIPAFKHYGSETRIVHFIGTGKPWLQQLDVSTRTVTPSPGSEHLAPLLQQWWDLFCEKVHPNLDKSLESNNDGMSHPPVEARSNFLPIALTDEPQTALVSEPCTPYREKDDFRQHNLPYLPFHVKGPSGELLNVGFLLASVVPPTEPEEHTDEQQRHEHRMEEKNDPIPQEMEFKKENERKDEDDNNNHPSQESHICVEHYEANEPEKGNEEKEFEGEQKEQQQQQEQQKEEPPPPPPPPKDPFDYYTFFPDETCISSYLEKNVMTYQPFDDHHNKPNNSEPEPEQSSPPLPRFLTIPQNDQRQSGNMNIQPEEEHQHQYHHQNHQHQQYDQHHQLHQQQHQRQHQHHDQQQHQHHHQHHHHDEQQHQHHHQHQHHDDQQHHHQHQDQPASEPPRDPPAHQPQKEATPQRQERQAEPVVEKRELSKSKSMSCFPYDVTTTEASPRRSIWKSQPDLNVDTNRRYSMPKLKPILPKQRSFSKSVPSAIPKVTLYTEFLMSSEYKDPVDLPKDKVGFVETHIRKLRRTKSDADITDKFGPLPYSPSPVLEKPSTPKRFPPRHFDNEYYDLTECKRQMGNKPKPKDADKRKETVHTLPALKPIVPAKDKKSTLIKKRKSKELSPGDGGREKILKRESKKARERKRESLITPRNVSTNASTNNLDEILERLREFSKDYQHFFGVGAKPLGKTVTCKNATVQASGQDGDCGVSEAFETFSTPVNTRSTETQTPKKAPVENSEFRQFRNYIKDRKETSQKGLLGIQDILSGSKGEEILKTSAAVKPDTKQSSKAEHSSLENACRENEESNSTNTPVKPKKDIESTKCEEKAITVDSSSSDGSSQPSDSRPVSSIEPGESTTEVGLETSTHSKDQIELPSYDGESSLKTALYEEHSENSADATSSEPESSKENTESLPPSALAVVKESSNFDKNEQITQPEERKTGEKSTDDANRIEVVSDSSSKETVEDVPEIVVKFSKLTSGIQQEDYKPLNSTINSSNEQEKDVGDATSDIQQKEVEHLNSTINSSNDQEKDVSDAASGIQQKNVEHLNSTTACSNEQEKDLGGTASGMQQEDAKLLNSTQSSSNEQEKVIDDAASGIQQKDIEHLSSTTAFSNEQGKDLEQNEKTPSESVDTNKALRGSNGEITVVIASDIATEHKTQNGHVTPQEIDLPKLKELRMEDKITPQIQTVVPQHLIPQKVKRCAEKKPEQTLCVPDFDTPRTSRVFLPNAPASKPAEEITKTKDTSEKPRRSTTQEQRTKVEKSHGNGLENGKTNGLSNNSPDGAVRTVGKKIMEGKLVSPRTPSTPLNGNSQSEGFEESKTSSGIAGAIAQLSLEAGGEHTSQSAASTAQQEYLRRQNWETGNMDYMGRDSFDNIWSKICQTLEAKELEENAAGSPQSPTETSKTEEKERTAPTESPVSLSAILQKCPEYIETLPGEPAAGPVEDDEIIFSKPENRQSCLTNITEEEEAGTEGSAAVVPGTVKLSDILNFTPAAPVSGPASAQESTPAASAVPAPTPPSVPAPAPATTPVPVPALIPASPAVSTPVSTPAPVLTPASAPASIPASPTQTTPASAPVPSSAPPSIPVSPTQTTPASVPVPSSAPASIPASPTGTTPDCAKALMPVSPTAQTPASAPPSIPASPTGSAPASTPASVTTVACIPVAPPASPPAPTPVSTPTPVSPSGSTPSSIPPPATTPAPPDQTKGADKIVEQKAEVKAEPGTPSDEQDKKPQESPKPEPGVALSEKVSQPEPGKVECKTVAIIPQPADGQKKAETTPQQEKKTEECKTVAIPSPPIVFPGAPCDEKDKRKSKMAEEKPQVQLEPIPLPPPSPTSAPAQDPTPIKTTRSDSLKEEGKQKKGVFSKILEMVGVAPKEKNGGESKSVFYDVDDDRKSTQNSEKQTPELKETEKPAGEAPVEAKQAGVVPEKVEEKPADVKKAEESQTKQEESKTGAEITKKPEDQTTSPPDGEQKPGQSPFPKPARGSSPKEAKQPTDAIQVSAARRSPSPKLTIPTKPPETEIIMPTPPPQPDVPPRRNSALLKVDETILQTPPVPEPPKETGIDESIKGKVTTEIEDIIGKAKSEVESMLQERRSVEKDTGEASDLINTMKLMMGSEQPGKSQQEEVEELRVTSEEERKRHKGEVVTSKLSDQILKAIPPPRRKAISEASASTSAIPKPTAAAEPKGAAGESSKPKPTKPSSIPVPPPRNRGKPTQPPAPAPSKAKGKK